MNLSLVHESADYGEIDARQNGVKEGELNEKLQNLKRNLKRPITIQTPCPKYNHHRRSSVIECSNFHAK